MSIRYPGAIFDDEQQQWIFDSQVVENRRHGIHLAWPQAPGPRPVIVRRVKRLNPKSSPQRQDEFFSVYRHHAEFTVSTEPM